MENEIEKKIKDLKEFIKLKTDQGTANYLGKELRELCGMVETEALRIPDVVGRRELLKPLDADFTKALNDLTKSKAGNKPTKKRF